MGHQTVIERSLPEASQVYSGLLSLSLLTARRMRMRIRMMIVFLRVSNFRSGFRHVCALYRHAVLEHGLYGRADPIKSPLISTNAGIYWVEHSSA
jgi:hypothetical protein